MARRRPSASTVVWLIVTALVSGVAGMLLTAQVGRAVIGAKAEDEANQEHAAMASEHKKLDDKVTQNKERIIVEEEQTKHQVEWMNRYGEKIDEAVFVLRKLNPKDNER